MLCLLASRAATAEGPALSQEAEQHALSLYREGVDLAREGRWKQAEDHFERVARIRAAPPVLFALARAQIENGKFATAKGTLERACRNEDPQYAGIVEQASEELRLLAPRIPRVELDVPSDVARATVTVDGAQSGDARDIELDCCAPHTVVVAASGRRSFLTTVTLREGEHLRVSAVLPLDTVRASRPPDGVSSAREPTEPSEPRPNVIGPLILGGSGAAAAIVGLVLRVTGQNVYDDAVRACAGDPPRCASEDDVQRGNAARSRIMAGTITAGVGLAALAGAGIWWTVARRRDHRTKQRVELGVRLEAGAPLAVIRGAL
jgi:hypothetical protein